MQDQFNFLFNDELTVLKLRKLYESCGYKKFRMSKFESYDFYARNKDFLVGNRIITFTDLNGKLMALKPDVTLSIVKNAENFNSRQKLYYTENVYRESKEIHEFKEISQVGLEVIGNIDLYQTIEIIVLAIQSLRIIDSDAVLDLSHMGYTEGLMDCMTVDSALRTKIHTLFKEKNSHDLVRLASDYSLPNNSVHTALSIMTTSGSNEEMISLAENNAINTKMSESVKEMKLIYELIKSYGLENNVKIDFSVTDDPGYYNGILMHGYVHGIPRDVLSGGRYDMLMSKMGKNGVHAMGFAIYFDALDRKLHTKDKNSPDAYILYDDSSDISVLLDLTKTLSLQNITYTAVKSLPENIFDTKIYIVDGEAIKEDNYD